MAKIMYISVIIDDHGVEWHWKNGRFLVIGSDAADQAGPTSGYPCPEGNVPKALGILFAGDYISEYTFNNLIKRYLDDEAYPWDAVRQHRLDVVKGWREVRPQDDCPLF